MSQSQGLFWTRTHILPRESHETKLLGMGHSAALANNTNKETQYINLRLIVNRRQRIAASARGGVIAPPPNELRAVPSWSFRSATDHSSTRGDACAEIGTREARFGALAGPPSRKAAVRSSLVLTPATQAIKGTYKATTSIVRSVAVPWRKLAVSQHQRGNITSSYRLIRSWMIVYTSNVRVSNCLDRI